MTTEDRQYRQPSEGLTYSQQVSAIDTRTIDDVSGGGACNRTPHRGRLHGGHTDLQGPFYSSCKPFKLCTCTFGARARITARQRMEGDKVAPRSSNYVTDGLVHRMCVCQSTTSMAVSKNEAVPLFRTLGWAPWLGTLPLHPSPSHGSCQFLGLRPRVSTVSTLVSNFLKRGLATLAVGLTGLRNGRENRLCR